MMAMPGSVQQQLQQMTKFQELKLLLVHLPPICSGKTLKEIYLIGLW